jgi:hypothetical protein
MRKQRGGKLKNSGNGKERVDLRDFERTHTHTQTHSRTP